MDLRFYVGNAKEYNHGWVCLAARLLWSGGSCSATTEAERSAPFWRADREEKGQAEKILEEEFADKLWDAYLQASDMDSEKHRQISAYREISSFLQKATGGQYKWEDIYKDTDKSGNVKIAGLPGKLCELLSSQENNGKYEQLRDDIFCSGLLRVGLIFG